MKIFSRFIAVSLAIMIPAIASAQMSLEIESDEDSRGASFADSVRLQRLSHNYFNEALYRHERKLIRQERNSLEVNAALQGSMTQLSDSWVETSGGDNTVTLLSSVNIRHIFKKNDFTLTSFFAAKFGYYHVVLEEKLSNGDVVDDPVWFKNQDEFQFSITPSLKLSDNWSYGATVKFRSQFAKGYVSSNSQKDFHLKSDFMSPGYLDVSGGLIYKSPNEKYPFTVSLSPVALSAVYVKSKEVRENAQYKYKDHESNKPTYVEPYGVAPTSTSKYEGGFSVQVDYDKFFGKNDFLRYTTSLFSFYGWMSQVTGKNIYKNADEYEAALDEWGVDKTGTIPMLSIHPTVRWENKINIRASKFITTTLSYQMYYNRAQNTKIQSQTLLSVGLAYTFRSK